MPSGEMTFAPADSFAQEYIVKLKPGQLVLCDVRRKRNPQFHRHFWAVAHRAFDNQETYPSVELLVIAAKLKAGCVDSVVIGDDVALVPKSLSWADMTEDDFSSWYSKLVEAMSKITGIPAHVLDAGDETV